MSKLSVGIVDYGVGNQNSVRQSLQSLGLRVRVSAEPLQLDSCDVLLLPGVGAFQPAMESLRSSKLDQYLASRAEMEKPIVGICLGMQLLSDGSHEGGFTQGLQLIPGEIVPLGRRRWHIGWNTLERVSDDPIFKEVGEQAFYFNHAYTYEGPEQFHVCTTRADTQFVSVIRRRSIIGVQFHPEKSQGAGEALLRRIIEGLRPA